MNNIKNQLKCPKCNKDRVFTSRQGYNYAIRNNSVCNVCSKLGIHFSEEHKKKISETRIKNGTARGQNNPMYGMGHLIKGQNNPMWGKFGKNHPSYGNHTMSIEGKQKLKELANKKKDLNYREKLSKLLIGKNKGQIRSEETKRKMRISKLKRLESLGIGTGEDVGAREWFLNYNKENNTNYKPKKIIEIGYIADGYDEILHSWIEYDTPYHRPLCRQQKDLIRQSNIIKYFESINKPLKSFIRIKVDNNGNVIDSNQVYGK
jgi:hypothetical protein